VVCDIGKGVGAECRMLQSLSKAVCGHPYQQIYGGKEHDDVDFFNLNGCGIWKDSRVGA
jgi:hypothetical protein